MRQSLIKVLAIDDIQLLIVVISNINMSLAVSLLLLGFTRLPNI